jgi:hypothetical protein
MIMIIIIIIIVSPAYGFSALALVKCSNEGGPGPRHNMKEDPGTSTLHCPKTTEMNFNLGVLNLYEIHFIALFSVKDPYSISNILLHRI